MDTEIDLEVNQYHTRKYETLIGSPWIFGLFAGNKQEDGNYKNS